MSQQAAVALRVLPADLDTPVAAALKLLASEPYSFVLESVEGGEARGRYSFLGWAPDVLYQCKDGCVSQADLAQSDPDLPHFVPIDAPPLEALQAAIDAARLPGSVAKALPIPGLVGYLGYDMVRLVERLDAAKPSVTDMPDTLLMRPTLLAVFDSVKDELTLIAIDWAGHGANLEDRLDAVVDALSQEVSRQVVPLSGAKAPSLSVNVSREAFCKQVETAKTHIEAGDIFQVVLSRRFSMPFERDSFALYRSLRRLNPAPFLFHLKFGPHALIGSSPEILVRVRGGKVTLRPIAGTRPRGKTETEDLALEADLLADAKERAEHLMLLDLGRNDVGRVAEANSIRVTQSFQIERYSHVMHIVSNVEGDLDEAKSTSEALLAGFPAGTVSGAPKVRAMQIIDDLERDGRGPYAGAVGYFGANGDMDSCIVLRTAILSHGMLHVQAGAGIVADSDPMAEALECEQKAEAILSAARQALGTASG
ncbi:MAG: anthranilate synthase component I [Pseudomonadota bacterium]